MTEITDNITVCVFSFIENKTRFNILNTTDIKIINNDLYYSDQNDKELFAGRRVRLKNSEGKETKYIISDVVVHYFSGERFNNRPLVGDKCDYNVQIIVHLDKD